MGKVKDELMNYAERHNIDIDEISEKLSLFEIMEENRAEENRAEEDGND